MKKAIKVAGILGFVTLSGTALYKFIKHKKENKNIEIKTSHNNKNVDAFRPDSFNSLDQVNAYDKLLELFENNGEDLHRYINDNYGDINLDYIKILEEYKNR